MCFLHVCMHRNWVVWSLKFFSEIVLCVSCMYVCIEIGLWSLKFFSEIVLCVSCMYVCM